MGGVITNSREPEVTFGDFAALARRRGWTVDFLTEQFRERTDKPRELFERVFQGQYADVVIPYRSVLAFYGKSWGCTSWQPGSSGGVRVAAGRGCSTVSCLRRKPAGNADTGHGARWLREDSP
jgi:hypothetical protein